MDYKKYELIKEKYKNKEIDKELYDNLIDNIIKDLDEPNKIYYKIDSNIIKNYYINKEMKDYLYKYSNNIINSNNISDDNKNIIKCLLMNSYFSDYNYDLSERYSKELLNTNYNNIDIINNLANYYIKTRRYTLASSLFKIIYDENNEKIKEDYQVLKNILNNKKKEYLPLKKENVDKYINFMKKIGIEVEINNKKQPNKIPVREYPIPQEVKIPDFDSFVAFDLETTGRSHTIDAITEIGAIKVVNGKIIETKEFIFQELVKPYKKRIPDNVERLTGITNEMVSKSRDIWEVFSDFVEFIGDNILVGYNCMTFDSKFMVRAGRLSNIVIDNKYFDVMKLAKKYKNIINSDNVKLEHFANKLGIINPQAHRALADAITTAKVYLELKKMEDKINE